MARVKRLPGGQRVADLLLWLVIAAPLLLPGDEVPPEQPAGLPLLWVRIAAVPGRPKERGGGVFQSGGPAVAFCGVVESRSCE